MVGHLMEGHARRAEHFVARVTVLGMCLAEASITVAASLGRIVTARIAGCVLNTRDFDDRTLHGPTPEVVHSACFRLNRKAGLIALLRSWNAKSKLAAKDQTACP